MSNNRLFRWVKEFWCWLGEGKIVIMCLLVITAAGILGCVTWQSEVSIRSAGYALQLIGMIFAIRGVLSIRTHFGQPLLRQIFFKWLKRYPKWKRSVIMGAGSGQFASSTMKARGEVWSPDNPEKSVEERINCIVSNLDRIRLEQRRHDDSIYALKDSHEAHKKSVADRTKKLEEDLRSDLESLHTSDLITTLVGLVWLTVGITMSTLAPELYKLLYPA